MAEVLRTVAYIIIGILLGIISTMCWQHFVNHEEDVVLQKSTVETRVERDTIYVREPSPVAEKIVRYVPIRFDGAKRDTIVLQDTLLIADVDSVMIPITQKVYSDSTYTAYVSGYQPSLDSINVYQRTIYKTITNDYVRNKRFGVGVTAGYGYNFVGKKLSPYIGIGITYTLWHF